MYKVTFIFLFISSICFAQQNEFSFTGYYGNDIHNEPAYMAGINYELAVSDKVSLNYSFKLGHSPQEGFTLQSPIGAYGGSLLFIWGLGQEDDYYTLGIIACFFPEGVTFNFPIDEQTTISPYINPFALEYTSQYTASLFEAGVKIKQYINDNGFISFNFGLKSIYRTANPIGFVGGSIGFIVK